MENKEKMKERLEALRRLPRPLPFVTKNLDEKEAQTVIENFEKGFPVSSTQLTMALQKLNKTMVLVENEFKITEK